VRNNGCINKEQFMAAFKVCGKCLAFMKDFIGGLIDFLKS